MSNKKKKSKKVNKKEVKKKSIMPIIITIIAIIVVVAIIACGIHFYKKHKEYENDSIIPKIAYTFNNGFKKTITEDNTFFNTHITIIWTEDCSGTIKRNGEVFSKENNTVLNEDGNYEITVSSPTGKNKKTVAFIVDTVPPSFETEKDSKGNYIITFADISDISVAKLTKINPKTQEIVEEKDLMKDGLTKTIEVKEKGEYELTVSDKYSNSEYKIFKVD